MIEPRLVCRACGKRGADVRPDFLLTPLAGPVGELRMRSSVQAVALLAYTFGFPAQP
jgi:hypothetical protein